MAVGTNILRYFTADTARAVSGVNGEICEIRLRAGGRLCVTLESGCELIDGRGAFVKSADKALPVTAEDVRHCFEAVCRYSVHSCREQINRGFVTVAGGHRAGICGTAVYSAGGKIDNIKYISGINFRIAREVIGAADVIARTVLAGYPRSILLFGEPCSGKTTILRDLCRQAGDRYPVSLIDERFEIAGSGGAGNRVGLHTDVFGGYSKADGINTAVRVMSPRMVFCDEIGSPEDIKALEKAWLCGVKAAASVHAGSVRQLRAGGVFPLIACGAFEYAVLVRERRAAKIYSRDELMMTGDGNV